MINKVLPWIVAGIFSVGVSMAQTTSTPEQDLAFCQAELGKAQAQAAAYIGFTQYLQTTINSIIAVHQPVATP